MTGPPADTARGNNNGFEIIEVHSSNKVFSKKTGNNEADQGFKGETGSKRHESMIEDLIATT